MNKNNNNILFPTNSKIDLYNNIYAENERAMINHKVNIREKSERTAIILENIASNYEMETAAFISNTEIRHTININSDSTLYDDIINNIEDLAKDIN